jgi:hypothetical protein
MNKVFIAGIAAAAISAGNAVPASAQSNVSYTDDPIQIVRYAVHPEFATGLSGGDSSAYVSDANPVIITISFVNTGKVPVTSVRFVVHAGNAAETIVDKGTFSSRVNITHNFAAGSELDDMSAIEIEGVTLADGSSWERA